MRDVIAKAADELGGRGEGASHRRDGAGQFGAQFGALATTGQHDRRRTNRPGQVDQGPQPALDRSRIEARVIHPRDVRVDQPDRQPAGEDLVREHVNEFGGQRGRDVITNSRQGAKVDLAEALPADLC